MALSLALKVNHSLLRLDLDREPKKESVKSFIETQKALLAEIQNGCKRNFILAKEKEEKEQKLQQSASMPEITVTEPLEEGPGEEVEEALASTENGDAERAASDDRDGVTDSDSDTDEETDPGLETKDFSQSQQPTGGLGSPAGSPTCAASQGNERRISVSSPGRGHKIFVVTRVESLPERTPENTTCPRETAAKPAEPQTQLPAPKTELSDSRANGTVSEPAASSETPPVGRSGGSSPERSGPAPCENAIHDTPLPNGLKTDFARALPDADGDGKLGSCAVEHGKSPKELEELLLEASQDTGQEPL
uniref:Uncharacterized protein n=1 Tax=Dromaius novaehollandiae TaxID=8790 RepID=A0A8C4JRT7_DRONO